MHTVRKTTYGYVACRLHILGRSKSHLAARLGVARRAGDLVVERLRHAALHVVRQADVRRGERCLPLCGQREQEPCLRNGASDNYEGRCGRLLRSVVGLIGEIGAHAYLLLAVDKAVGEIYGRKTCGVGIVGRGDGVWPLIHRLPVTVACLALYDERALLAHVQAVATRVAD